MIIRRKCCKSSKLLSLVYKEPIQIDQKKVNNLIEKWAKDVNREFKEREIERARTHKRGLN